MRRPGSLFAAALSLCLVGCGSAPTSQLSGGTASTTAAAGQPVPNRAGIVFLGKPQAATVSIVSKGTKSGEEIYQTQATETGNFYLPELEFSGRFKVVATLTDGTRLEKTCDGSDYLFIDLISHLTSLYAGRHSELTLAQAQQAVIQGLGIPAGTGTNGMSSLAGSPFSTRLFLEQANQNGGFDAYCQGVVAQIEAGRVVNFKVPPALALRFLGKQFAPEAAIAPKGVLDVFKLIGETAGGDVVSFGVDSLMSAGCSAMGLNIGTANNLKEIETTLSEIQSEVTALTGLIKALAIGGTYKANYNIIDQTINPNLQTNSDLLAQQASSASAANNTNSTQANTFDHGPAVPALGASLLAGLDAKTFETYTHQLVALVSSDTTEDDNLVLSYNLLFASSVYPSQNKFNKAQHFNYTFRQDNWTVGNATSNQNPPRITNLQANLDYGRSSALTAMNLWSESAQLAILPQPQSSSRSSPATDLNLARSGGGNDGILKAQMDLAAAQNQVPLPFGNAEVFVDLAQNKMWYLHYMDGTQGRYFNEAMSTLSGFQLGPWKAGPYPTVTQSSALSLYTGSDGEHPTGPGGGWRFPTEKECQDLRNAANASNQFGLKGMGFDVPSGSNHKIHLYGTPVPSGSNYGYYAFDWNTGKHTEETSGGSGPQWDYMYVRNIPDYRSGDSMSLAHSCYGFLPDSMFFTLNNGQVVNSGATVAGIQNGQLRLAGDSNGAAGTGGQFSNLTETTRITSSNATIMDFSPSGGGGYVTTHWHAPGTVTVTATRLGASASIPPNGVGNLTVQSSSISIRMTSPLTGNDSYKSLRISPYNLGLTGPPDISKPQQFYLLGFYTGGGVVDLSEETQYTWAALDENLQPLDPSIASFSTAGTSRASLNFGLNSRGHHNIVIQVKDQNQSVQAQARMSY